MDLLFYAQPYNIDAKGFYFRDIEEYQKQAIDLTDSFGQPVEEFEIQFIDGELIDAEFAKVAQINQANIATFITAADAWDEDDKTRFIIAVGECGYSFDLEKDDITALEIDFYSGVESLKELAEQFVDDGLFGDMPERFQFYLDYELIARDLSMDYTETTINGSSLVYRCS